MELRGAVAVITGASKGLGRATALAFARDGASLALCARGQAELDRAAAETRALGAETVAVAGDLRSPRDIERLVTAALERFHRVDVLMNNASELGPTPLPFLADYSPSAFEDVIRVNVVAPFRLTQSLIGGMLRRGRGVILNVSSDVAVTGYAGWGAYAASKAALDGLTRTWAAELEGTGVRIHAVDPGDMDTELHRAALPDDDPAELLDPASAARAFVRIVRDDALASGRVRGPDLLTVSP